MNYKVIVLCAPASVLVLMLATLTYAQTGPLTPGTVSNVMLYNGTGGMPQRFFSVLTLAD